MTHDELMSALNIGITMTGNRLATHEEDAFMYRKALRAVVELSKPYLAGEVYVNPEFNQGVMAAFRLVIDAIEKELK